MRKEAVTKVENHCLLSSKLFNLPCCCSLQGNSCELYGATINFVKSQLLNLYNNVYVGKKFFPSAVMLLLLRQLCRTLCNPIDSTPPGSTVPGILQARTLEWVAISFSNAWKWKVKVKSLSRVQLFLTPRTAAYQAPLSMGFSRQEYWSGVPLPSPCCYTSNYFLNFSYLLRECMFYLSFFFKVKNLTKKYNN